ncbi:MAG: hypothetical protein Kow0063_43300 [Anaerolineae bacterium]
MDSRKILKGCALLLIVGLLLLSGPLPGEETRIGLAQGPEETVVLLGDASEGPPDLFEGTELIEKRTLTSKTFQLGPDRYRAIISAAPMHFMDGEGNWQDIKPDIERRADEGYQVEANVVKARFPEQIGAGQIEIELPSGQVKGPNSTWHEPTQPGDLAAAGSGAVALSWQPRALAYSSGGDLTAQRISWAGVRQALARVSGNSLVYENALPGVTEEFRVVPGGVKHALILSQLPDFVPEQIPPDSFLDYEVEMRLSPGISLYVDGAEQRGDFSTSSVIELRRGQKEIVGYLLAPYAFERDNPREMTPGTHMVHFEPGHIVVTVRIPLDWLAAPDRAYPVVIDPTTNAYLIQDTFIASGFPSSSFGHWVEMYAGYDSVYGYGLEKSLIRWRVDPIPASSTINTAEIWVNLFSSQGNTSCTLGFYRMLTPWSSSYASWYQRDFGNSWNSPGAGGMGSDYDGAGYGFIFPASTGWFSTGDQAGFGSWVSGWIANPSSNYGVMLKPPGNPTTYDCERGFRTFNYGAGPYLEVDYTFTGGAPTLLVHNTPQTHTYPDPEDYYQEATDYTIFWRGTAMRPTNQSDFDLWLHTQPDFSEWRVGSTYGVGRVDYTLTKEYVTTTGYPRVVWFDGTDNYNIHYMHRIAQLNPPYSGLWIIEPNALWWVYEVYLDSPGTWQVVVTPVSGDPDLGVAIHDPTTGDYHTRGSALALSDQIGQNLIEQIEFTASSPGYYGLVVWSNIRTGVSQQFLLEVKAPLEKIYLPAILKNYVPPQGPFSNGGFENDSRWLLAGELEHQRTTAKHRSGSYSLQLGHDGEGPCLGQVPCSGSGDDCESFATATQGFDVPGSGSPSLGFYYQIYTYDHKPTGDRAADYFAAYIRDLSTGEETLVYRDDLSWVSNYQCYNLSQKSNWQSVSGINLSAYKGKTVQLIFKVTNGGHNYWNTWVFIDDVTCSGC